MPTPRRRWTTAPMLALVLATLLPAQTSAKVQPLKTPPQIAQFVHVTLPITGPTVERTRRIIRRAIEKAKRTNTRLVLIVEFDVPKGQKVAGRSSDFGAAYSLANFLSSDELNGVRTVAYLPNSIEGHAVLPVIACQEIIMAKDATLGAAGIDDKTITAPERSAYAEIAGRRRTIPPTIALGLLDSAVEILQVDTETEHQFVSPEDLEKLKKEHATKEPVVVKRAGETFAFSGSDARRWGFARYLAANRRDVAKALELPPTAIEDDPSLEGGWRAVRIELRGPIREETASRVQRMIEDHVRNHDANFVCLWIDSPGGHIEESMRLANFLAFDLDPSKVRTVAYVPSEARADAAIVALACDQVVVHPRAILGGSGAYEPTDREIEDARRVIQRELAPRKGRPWSLLVAMIDPNLTVFRATHLGEVEYFCDKELDEQFDPAAWDKGEVITVPGRPLRIDGAQAEEFHLANQVVESFAQFRQFYGLENDPTLLEPGWADTLIRALASPGVAVLLFLIGGAGLYIELHAPGTGIGAFVAAVCFLLFFWSHYLDGTAGWLEVLLFAAGISCLAMEVFVIPGFGIFGLGGGAMILASLVLASQTFVWPHNDYQLQQLQDSLLTLAAAAIGIFVVAALLRHRLPRSQLFGRLMLAPPEGDEAESIRHREALVDFHDLIGTQGTTTTQLTPSGKAQFGDSLVDVMADGEVIDRGVAVEVVEVRGSRVLVRELEARG